MKKGKAAKKAAIAVVTAVAVGGVSVGGYYGIRQAQKTTVKVYPVSDFTSGYWGDSMNMEGQITSTASQNIYLSDSQTISQVLVKEGDVVNAGDTLMTYDTSMIELDLETQQLQLAQTKLKIQQSEKELEKLKKAGRLDETMEALAAYYQREEEILDEVKSAVTYPVAMLGMLLVIVAVLFIKVMPVFEQVYMQLGQEMTGVARQLLNIGGWMRQSAIVLVVLAVVILIIVFFVIFYKKARIEFISKIQTIGFMKKIAWKRARTRFASGMAMALKSGLDMDESLSLSEKLTDYEPLKMKIQQCQEQMKEGETFPKALKEAHIFDGMQERLMIIGYETGAVDEVMEQAADLYQKQLQDQIQKMIAVLEPTLVGILCVIVGIILLSVMLPLVGIMAGIG